MEMGYTSWIEWLLTDRERVDDWFESQRWSGWREEVGPLALDTAISAYPFAWTKEGKDPSQVTRQPVAAREVVALTFDFARQIEDLRIPGPRLATR